MKNSLLALALVLLVAAPLQAQRKVLAVGNVKINPSVETAAKAEGTLLPLQRVTEAIDGQLIDALNGTRKFEIIARSDLDSLLEEGGFTGEGLQVGGSDYLVVPAVDDFQDIVETFSANGRQATKRTIRLGMIARIYDSESGKLIESANFQFDNREAKNILGSVQRKGEYSAALLRQIAEEMAEKCANRVVDVIYPARIIAVTGPQATINRGDGTGIESGQLWDAYALGEELIDPDTGESLGRTEVKVGTIRIDRVTPKFSTGTITENFGVSKGAVVRKAQ
jgi:curli biogenesis system outer membrane secretion channel CsgG